MSSALEIEFQRYEEKFLVSNMSIKGIRSNSVDRAKYGGEKERKRIKSDK